MPNFLRLEISECDRAEVLAGDHVGHVPGNAARTVATARPSVTGTYARPVAERAPRRSFLESGGRQGVFESDAVKAFTVKRPVFSNGARMESAVVATVDDQA